MNALSYLKKIKETGTKPDFVAGHSLGEYNALFAANDFDFETGLKSVQKRGALMSQASGGGMAAVIGLPSEKIQAILREHNLSDLHIANFNSYSQIVISGDVESIKNAESTFINAGATLYMPLKVSGAFHSPFMNKAKEEFANFLRDYSFEPPMVPIISNVTAKPYQLNEISKLLSEQMTSSVHWTQTIEYLHNQGETVIDEIGPGKVISGLIARIKKNQ